MTENVITVNNIEIHTLEADEGYCLTDGSVFSDEGDVIYLGCNDIKDRWYEITEEEKEERMEEIEARLAGETNDLLDISDALDEVI